MLEFNTIGIKGPEDLRQALQVKMSVDSFKSQMDLMISHYGPNSVLSMLYFALYGTHNGPPLITFTHHIVDNFDQTQDPWDHYVEPLK